MFYDADFNLTLIFEYYQIIFRFRGVVKVSTDVAVHDGRFFKNPESVFTVHFHQESAVDVGMSVLTPVNKVHENPIAKLILILNKNIVCYRYE